MSQNSTNLTLLLEQVPEDDAVLTGNYINAQSGYASTSNMQRIDAFAGETRNAITDLKGTGYTNQTVKGNFDLIQATNQRITYTAVMTGTNTLVGTISELLSIQNNINIKIIPTASNTSGVTVNINGTGALPLTKVQNWTGSTVYSALSSGDLQPNQPVIITKSNDGLRYIYIGLENTARNIYFENSANNYTNLQDKFISLDSVKENKNYIINGAFDIWQRNTTQTDILYGSDDRWTNNHTVSTKTHSQQPFTIGQTVVPNNPKYFSRTVVTTGGTASSSVRKGQAIEDVTILSGKTVSISFWAKADSNKNLSIEMIQYFGSGGSATITGIATQKVSLTSTWARYTLTTTLPSVSGKTIGAGDYTALYFWYDAGSDFNVRTNSLGNQSGTFDIANVSLVEGYIPQEYQPKTFDEVLKQCLRYFKKSYNTSISVGTASTVGVFRTTAFNTFYLISGIVNFDPMRITPTVSIYSTSGAINKMKDATSGLDKNASTIYAGEKSFLVYDNTGSLVTGNEIQFQWSADAEL